MCQTLGYWLLWQMGTEDFPPSFSRVHMTVVKDPVQAQILAEEILTLLQKEAIVRINSSEQLARFYSKCFLVPKKDGGLHPILGLTRS